MAAERAVIEIELVSDMIVYRLRDANSAGLGERLDPGGDVDAIAKDVVAIDDYIAEVDTDPQLEPAFGRERIVDPTRGALHLDGAVDRVDDTREIGKQAVARCTDDPSAMRPDKGVDNAAKLAERSMRACLIHTHQPAETDYIRVQNGGEFPLPGRRFTRETRRVIEQGAHRGCV
jgi:hypothetical protein